jgi:CRP/FNR family transcriptional regulator
MNDSIVKIIEKNDYFKDLNRENKALLAEIAVPRRLKKRETVFMEGDKGHALFLCAEGAVQLVKTSQNGQEVVIKVVGPGEVFGEVILFGKDRYPASASALENTLVYLLPKIQFHCLLENGEFRNDFISILLQKMRYLAERIQYLTAHDVEDRFWKFLTEHYGGRKSFAVSLSKKDMSAAVGTTPETFSRLVLRLKNEGKLKWEGKKITIKV